MEWTRRTLMIAIAMRDKGSSQQRWELYQRLCQNEWTEEKFTLEMIHQELSLEEIEWPYLYQDSELKVLTPDHIRYHFKVGERL